jgi:hypothetical protein
VVSRSRRLLSIILASGRLRMDRGTPNRSDQARDTPYRRLAGQGPADTLTGDAGLPRERLDKRVRERWAQQGRRDIPAPAANRSAGDVACLHSTSSEPYRDQHCRHRPGHRTWICRRTADRTQRGHLGGARSPLSRSASSGHHPAPAGSRLNRGSTRAPRFTCRRYAVAAHGPSARASSSPSGVSRSNDEWTAARALRRRPPTIRRTPSAPSARMDPPSVPRSCETASAVGLLSLRPTMDVMSCRSSHQRRIPGQSPMRPCR